LSDLHCPARFTLATDGDVDQAGLRPAAVYVTAPAEELAGQLGARYDVLDGPLPAALETLADQYRGEDVLVLVTADEIEGLPGAEARIAPLRIDIDADGWVHHP
jgi:hypothetical protein